MSTKSNTICISPYSKAMRNGENNPKNYPYWPELIDLLHRQGLQVLQVGVEGERQLPGVDKALFNLPLVDLRCQLQDCITFISVDNFLPHFAHYYKIYGIVLWGQSNPEIFGYTEHVNLFAHKRFFRDDQFDIWEKASFQTQAFVKPSVV